MVILLTFSQIYLYLSKNVSSFIEKEIHLILSKYILYILILGRNNHKDLIFAASLQPIKYLKSFLSKGSLLDTTILLISILFTKIGLLY